LGERTTMEFLKCFVAWVQACFESTYLRQPTWANLVKQLVMNEARGFLSMFASINCMHYQWKNCFVAWQGQFQDMDWHKSIILEAITNKSLWTWHTFFSLHRGNNDINVLNRSPLVTNMFKGESTSLIFSVNGFMCPRYYMLVDGIYPRWSCFVQRVHEPQDEKRSHLQWCKSLHAKM
jgi:hypothetical protein